MNWKKGAFRSAVVTSIVFALISFFFGYRLIRKEKAQYEEYSYFAADTISGPLNQHIERYDSATKRLSIPEFASKLKKKFPQYENLSDTDLVIQTVAKYPEYIGWLSAPIDTKTLLPYSVLAQNSKASYRKSIVLAILFIGFAAAIPLIIYGACLYIIAGFQNPNRSRNLENH